MSVIIRDENSNHSTLSIYHIALTLIGYISFYNALTELNKVSEANNKRKSKNLQTFLCFANTMILKDFAIVVNELYVFFESLNTELLNKHNIEEPRFDEFLRFIKKIKNNMKFHPSEKKIDKIISIEKNKYPNIFGKYNKDLLYYCGYFMGNNVIFGSSWYLAYMFYESKKLCKNNNDLYLFTDSIQTHIKSIYRMFEKVLFDNDVEIPKTILNKPKRFFQIYNQTIDSEKVLKKSKYDKITTFMLFLIIEEIASMQIYYDYFLDIEESIKQNLLLFFYTYILAIKYDEIRDCIENLINNSEKLGIDKRFKMDFSKLKVFNIEVTGFAYKLRNSYHHTEVAKYKAYANDNNEIKIKMEDLYLKITQSKKWSEDYINMMKKMKFELNEIITFCRKNIGIKY